MRQKTDETQRTTRRDLLRKIAAAGPLLVAPAALAARPATKQAACPVDFGDWSPDELTPDDAVEIVLSACGFGNGHSDDDILGLLWRFHTMSTDEAARWLRRVNGSLQECVAKQRAEHEARRAAR